MCGDTGASRHGLTSIEVRRQHAVARDVSGWTSVPLGHVDKFFLNGSQRGTGHFERGAQFKIMFLNLSGVSIGCLLSRLLLALAVGPFLLCFEKSMSQVNCARVSAQMTLEQQ